MSIVGLTHPARVSHTLRECGDRKQNVIEYLKGNNPYYPPHYPVPITRIDAVISRVLTVIGDNLK